LNHAELYTKVFGKPKSDGALFKFLDDVFDANVTKQTGTTETSTTDVSTNQHAQYG
jgi:hypothetical protein